MRSFKAALILVALTLLVCRAAFADSKGNGFGIYSMTAEPMREAIVSGDVQKYKAHHWIDSGYVGGIEDATWDYTMRNGLQVHMSGHALIGENDYKGEVLATKKNLGYFLFEYDEFRKYYNNTGGMYHPYTSLEHIETDKDLHMDMGKMRLELGLDKDNWPKISIAYEHETKHGAKSRLTWFDAYEGTVDKKISPSWAEVNEIVDTIEIKESHQIWGFDVEGEQIFEFMKTNVNRHEQAYSTNATASEHKRREQIQAPKSDLFSTHFGLERWFKDDKFFVSSGYRFYHLSNKEVEDIFEYNASGVLTNFSNAEQVRNAVAHNQYDAHTWVGNLMWMPKPWFSVIPRIKMELMKRKGDSSYPKDNEEGVVNGIIDQTALSNTDNKVGRVGESISIRFTKIPRTSLYAETELEQVRNWISEDRQSQDGPDAGDDSSANDRFNRETITRSYRGNFAIGANTSPIDKVYLTTQIKRRINNSDYDDLHESNATGTALSAFFIVKKSEPQSLLQKFHGNPKNGRNPLSVINLGGMIIPRVLMRKMPMSKRICCPISIPLTSRLN
jgi:hypothetical protein